MRPHTPPSPLPPCAGASDIGKTKGAVPRGGRGDARPTAPPGRGWVPWASTFAENRLRAMRSGSRPRAAFAMNATCVVSHWGSHQRRSGVGRSGRAAALRQGRADRDAAAGRPTHAHPGTPPPRPPPPQQKVHGREANRRRRRLTEPTTKALCQTPPRVQRTIKSSKNTVRTGVFVGHTVEHLINN